MERNIRSGTRAGGVMEKEEVELLVPSDIVFALRAVKGFNIRRQ